MIGIIDALLIVVFGFVTFRLASDGVWNAVLMTVSVLFAGLVAMNFFEPVAEMLESAGFTGEWSFRVDFIALMGLFAGTIGLMRLGLDQLCPDDIETSEGFNVAGGWAVGALCGWITICFLLTALHTAPMPREFLGFTPERKNLLNVVAPDRQWLGFVQHCSDSAFAIRESVSTGGSSSVQNRVFDAAYMDVPGSEQKRWPSFPMRYASRRAIYAGGGGVPVAVPAGGSATPAGGAPAGGGGGSVPDF